MRGSLVEVCGTTLEGLAHFAGSRNVTDTSSYTGFKNLQNPKFVRFGTDLSVNSLGATLLYWAKVETLQWPLHH
jgi:hypothetical protein